MFRLFKHNVITCVRSEKFLNMANYTNALIHENSPYLLQHAHNPVNWQPWGEEALSRAKKENKLIFISIGYAACHWCHVMERESFEDAGLAGILNAHFICIKVDREERPDIDQAYMSAIQLMTGSGGWPLSCFATPDAKPFYGGTYYPPDQFREIVNQLQELWTREPQKIDDSAKNLYEGIVNSDLIREKNEHETSVDPSDLFHKLSRDFDSAEGGMKRVPKFPMPGIYLFLLHYYDYSGDEPALSHVRLTVDKIIRGGIYDQLAGGISRYSTDQKWHVPHFEKMLYDNARFISLLSALYSLRPDEDYRKSLYECTGFLEKEMAGDDGGFYASIDADSGGEEGQFYTWTAAEIDEAAGDHVELIREYWDIIPGGNWESGKNVLRVRKDPEELAGQFSMSAGNVRKVIAEVTARLKSVRDRRDKPAIDTKILTSWNALVVKAFADAWQATGDRHFLDSAIRTGRFIRDNLINEDHSVRRSLKGRIPGFLDDYAFTADAFLALYEAGFEEEWLAMVEKLLEKILEDFYNIQTGMFYFASATTADSVVRQSEVADHVLPSSNAVLASLLLRASKHFDDDVFRRIARQMINNVMPYVQKSPAFFPEWAGLLLQMKREPAEIVITGPDCLEIRQKFTQKYLPGVLFAGAREKSEYPLFRDRFVPGSTRIYVCHDGSCRLPVSTVKEALNQL